MIFSHSGSTGDCIYSLPTCIAMSKGKPFTFEVNRENCWQGTFPFDEPVFSSLKALLDVQPYIKEVTKEIEPSQGSISFNDVLKDYRTKIISGRQVEFKDLISLHHEADKSGESKLSDEPFLMARDPEDLGMIVVNRTARYHNPSFPWKKIVEAYEGHMVFIGSQTEHAMFRSQFKSSIPRVPTNTLMDAANIIAGAPFFIGNQSACLAIAIGLGANCIVESSLEFPDCNFNRPNVILGMDDSFELPTL